jgi:two-component system chemotaxis response regulator CheY
MNDLNILLVDDSAVMRIHIRNHLRNIGLEIKDIDEAENGREALKLALERPFDICFCDWNMPIMNGIDFVEQFRKEQDESPMKIVMVTTEASPKRIAKVKKAGANAYITKPFNAEKLEKVIRKVLKK